MRTISQNTHVKVFYNGKNKYISLPVFDRLLHSNKLYNINRKWLIV